MAKLDAFSRENARRKNIFRDKQTTNKVSLMLLDVKGLTER